MGDFLTFSTVVTVLYYSVFVAIIITQEYYAVNMTYNSIFLQYIRVCCSL